MPCSTWRVKSRTAHVPPKVLLTPTSFTSPVLGNYGAEDTRINAHLDELVKAMVTYKKDFEMRIYLNAAHAFFHETTPLYNEAAASDAWERVLRFYKRALADASAL
jgi:dienelactone hydrolase